MKRLMLVLAVFFGLSSLTGCYVHGRHGGGHFLGAAITGAAIVTGAAIAGAIVAPIPPAYVPVCRNRIVRGYYTRDSYGYRVWVPSVVVRECY